MELFFSMGISPIFDTVGSTLFNDVIYCCPGCDRDEMVGIVLENDQVVLYTHGWRLEGAPERFVRKDRSKLSTPLIPDRHCPRSGSVRF